MKSEPTQLFLRDLYKIWIGSSRTKEITFYSGHSKHGLPVVTAVIRENGNPIAVFGSWASSGLDQELSRCINIANQSQEYGNWICQDYTVFDSPLQQEEAALVRGMIPSKDETELWKGLTSVVQRIENESVDRSLGL